MMRKRKAPVYPADWRDSFGMPVAEHTASTQIDLMEGYTFADNVARKKEEAPMIVDAEVIEEKTGEVV